MARMVPDWVPAKSMREEWERASWVRGMSEGNSVVTVDSVISYQIRDGKGKKTAPI